MRRKSEKNNNRATISIANLEQNPGYAAFSKDSPPKVDSPVNIRVISYRKLRHDTDGISAKAVIDGLVHAGILSDDTSEQVKEVTFESRKSKEERTVIEIEQAR